MINKNVDMELFRQLKGIDFEYLVQLSALIAENVETNGARELVESLIPVFNGKSISADVLDCSNRLVDQILELKSFKTSIDIIETAKRCFQNHKIDLDCKMDIIFKQYLAIWEVLNMIREQDWDDIDDMEVLVEEDILVKDYLLDYINTNVAEELETNADTVEFLCSCGLDNIYVRTLEDKDGGVCLVLTDDNENRLTDCYYLN